MKPERPGARESKGTAFSDELEAKETGDRIDVESTSVGFAVNGEENTTVDRSRTLEAILRNAGDGAAIDVSDLKSYYLENTVDGRRYDKLDDVVEIREGDNFLAIHVGRTPVACFSTFCA